jgi:hypothetical protein
MFAIFLIAALSGCGHGCFIDKTAFERSNNVGYLVEREVCAYDWHKATRDTSKRSFGDQIRDRISEVRRGIQQSGAYDAFEESFGRRMAERLSGRFHPLDKNTVRYVSGDEAKGVDAVGSAKAQGFDIVVEIWIQPGVGCYRDYASDRKDYTSVFGVDLIATRVSDGKVVWDIGTGCSEETGGLPNYEVFPELAQRAVAELLRMYDGETQVRPFFRRGATRGGGSPYGW